MLEDQGLLHSVEDKTQQKQGCTPEGCTAPRAGLVKG